MPVSNPCCGLTWQAGIRRCPLCGRETQRTSPPGPVPGCGAVPGHGAAPQPVPRGQWRPAGSLAVRPQPSRFDPWAGSADGRSLPGPGGG